MKLSKSTNGKYQNYLLKSEHYWIIFRPSQFYAQCLIKMTKCEISNLLKNYRKPLKLSKHNL